MKLGNILRELRLEANLSQIELACKLKVSKSIISQWELNQCEPTLSKLITISRYFKVSIDYLAGIEE